MTPDVDDDDDTIETLRSRLAEANETLRAIQLGEVDALIVKVGDSDRVYTLHTTDEPYRDLVEQMREGAIVLAPTGDILYCNAWFAVLVGEPLESVIGTPFNRFAQDPDCVQTLLNTSNGRCRCQLIGSDNVSIEVHLSLTTRLSRDVTRLNLIVTDLRELHAAYSSRDRARHDSELKDEFLAMLAHELRNPIGAINSAARVLELTDTGGARDCRARGVITRQVAQLSRLLDDLLDVERVVSGEIQLDRQPLDLAALAHRVIDVFAGDPDVDRRIGIGTEPVWVDGDPVRLEQALTNLVTNAVQNTPADGRILVSVRPDDDQAVLTIGDTGAGISPDLLPSIFDMFAQGDRTLDRAKGGLGLGLTLVRRLVELHGGTIVASSDGQGHGSTFTVRLPRTLEAETFSTPLSPPRRIRSRRVLLIEDNGDARAMLRLMLEFAGHVVSDAPDGVLGLALIESEHPDVAIIDIGLPGLDGYMVARRIRDCPNGRAMLLLALTGYGFQSDYQRSVEAGFDYHLVKPVDPDELARLLSQGAGGT